MNTIDLLITGGAIVTMDGQQRVIDNGFVAIRDERIVAVGDVAELKAKNFVARQTINARGKVVLPGLVNAHTHIPMVLF
ncbi:MAG: amidohydrolase family protein, partial [Blastocatellia bacterium]